MDSLTNSSGSDFDTTTNLNTLVPLLFFDVCCSKNLYGCWPPNKEERFHSKYVSVVVGLVVTRVEERTVLRGVVLGLSRRVLRGNGLEGVLLGNKE